MLLQVKLLIKFGIKKKKREMLTMLAVASVKS